MRNSLVFLAAGILIGFIVATTEFGGKASPSTTPVGGTGVPAVPRGVDAGPSSPADVASEKSGGAPGATIAPGQKQTLVTSPGKVVSVREAYRRAIKEEEKDARDADGNPPPRAEDGVPTTVSVGRSSGEVVVPGNAALPDEPAIIDQPRLWLPAAMLEPDQSIPITSELQVAEWEQLQEEFVQAVDGRAPSNETEKEAWIRAQQENDDLFRAKFGWDAFRQQQLKAYMEGLAPAPPP